MTQILEFTSEILSFLFPGNSPLEFFIWLCLFFFLASVHLPEDMAIYFVQILAKHGLLEYNIHKDAGETFGGNTEMSRAVAKCKCRFCGKEFERTATKQNTTEAQSWIAWTEKNINQCPDCYRAGEALKQIAGAVEVRRMEYKDYKNSYAGCSTVPGSYDAAEKTVEVIIDRKHKCMEEVIPLIPAQYAKNGAQRRFEVIWENRHKLTVAPENAEEWAVKVLKIVRKYAE